MFSVIYDSMFLHNFQHRIFGEGAKSWLITYTFYRMHVFIPVLSILTQMKVCEKIFSNFGFLELLKENYKKETVN